MTRSFREIRYASFCDNTWQCSIWRGNYLKCAKLFNIEPANSLWLIWLQHPMFLKENTHQKTFLHQHLPWRWRRQVWELPAEERDGPRYRSFQLKREHQPASPPVCYNTPAKHIGTYKQSECINMAWTYANGTTSHKSCQMMLSIFLLATRLSLQWKHKNLNYGC